MFSAAQWGTSARGGPEASRLALALAISLALHVAAITALHGFSPPFAPRAQPPIEVTFAQTPAPRPAPAPSPPAVQPAPPPVSTPSQRTVRVVPESTHPPRKALSRVRRKPIEARAAPAEPASEPLAAEASTPEIAPSSASAPQPRLPASRSPAPPSAAQALARYGQAVSELLSRYREYPPLARLRGWQGDVALRLKVGPDGKLAGATLKRSSGHDVLDEEALEMARRLARLPPPPEALRRRPFAVDVEVVFELKP